MATGALTGAAKGSGIDIPKGILMKDKMLGTNTAADYLKMKEEANRTQNLLGNPPQYDYEYMEVPDEIYEAADVYADTADELRGSAGDLRTQAGRIEGEARDIAGQRLDYAREYTDYLSESDMPGLDIYQEGISQSSAGAYGAINQMGGQGGLGAVNQIYQSELGALRDLAVSNAQYKQNTRQNVYNTMSMAFGDYANTVLGSMQTGANIQGQAAQLTGQAGQMQAAGLQNIGAAEQDVFGFNAQLDQTGFMINQMQPYQNQLEYSIAQDAYKRQEENAKKERWGQFGSSILQAGAQIGAAAIMSDRRLKEHINLVGNEKSYNLYEFNYIGNDKRFVGVMSDEVRTKNPEAVVVNENGYDMVNYDMLGIKFREA